MRTVLVLSVLAASLTARADDNRNTAVEARTLPPACAQIDWIPADARTMAPALEAYTSIASCIVSERTRALALTPDRESMHKLYAAVRQAFDLLDTVIETGDPAHQIIALRTEANIYTGMTVRMRNSVGYLPKRVSAKEQEEHYAKLRKVDDMTSAWMARARAAYRKVDQIAARDPSLERNPIVAAAVRESRIAVPPGVATR
jgi:hypothetical protein